MRLRRVLILGLLSFSFNSLAFAQTTDPDVTRMQQYLDYLQKKVAEAEAKSQQGDNRPPTVVVQPVPEDYRQVYDEPPNRPFRTNPERDYDPTPPTVIIQPQSIEHGRSTQSPYYSNPAYYNDRTQRPYAPEPEINRVLQNPPRPSDAYPAVPPTNAYPDHPWLRANPYKPKPNPYPPAHVPKFVPPPPGESPVTTPAPPQQTVEPVPGQQSPQPPRNIFSPVQKTDDKLGPANIFQ